MRKQLIIALLVLLTGTAYAATTDSAAPDRAERLKKLYSREPRTQSLIPAIEQVLAADASNDPAVKRRADFLEEVINEAPTISEERLRDDVDVLEKMTSTVSILNEGDRRELQERYAKVAALLDDSIFNKDIETGLEKHDRLIRHTSLGNYNKAKILDELNQIEQIVQDAPAIPYGRSELLRGLQEKRLLPPTKGAYLGLSSNEQMFLSSTRKSVGRIEEGSGAMVVMDTTDHFVQGPDGSFIDLTTANAPSNGLILSPPLSLWMKSRLLEGHVPVINFRLVDRDAEAQFEALGLTQRSQYMSLQDVIDGKMDGYFADNFRVIAETKTPVLVGLFAPFDRTVGTAFGADGRTPYYLLSDPKLGQLPADKLGAELDRRLAKGALVKDTGVELRRYYGDPTMPDGPERMRDAWKRVHKVATESGWPSMSLFSVVGSNHGNKKGLSADPYAGAQDWNKLHYYWPGEGVFDWTGTALRVSDVAPPATLLASLAQFHTEASGSSWQSIPLMVRDTGPASPLTGPQEAAWIPAAFQDVLQLKYPQFKAVFVAYPEAFTLISPDSRSAFRRSISSNPYYKQKLRLQDAR